MYLFRTRLICSKIAMTRKSLFNLFFWWWVGCLWLVQGCSFCRSTLFWRHKGEKMKQYFVYLCKALLFPLLCFYSLSSPFLFLILDNRATSGVFYFVKLSEVLRPRAPGCGARLDLNGRHGTQRLRGLAWSPRDSGFLFPPTLHSPIVLVCVCKMGPLRDRSSELVLRLE